jgi:isoamylase
MPRSISRGSPLTLGATPDEHGVNFAVFVEKSQPISLCLFDPFTRSLLEEIDIPYHTGQIRHVYVPNLKLPVSYGYRLQSSPYSSLFLLDPYAKALATSIDWGRKAEPYRPLGLVIPPEEFDWGSDAPLMLPKSEMILYEMHLRGFTKDASSGVKNPGTFLGMIDRISHLKALGVNAVELLPLHEFNESEYPPPEAPPAPLCQYWGYSSVNFFALMNRYASSSAPGSAIHEFKTLVKALHSAGIEVILDVVYNHTAEGNGKGPVYSYKALGNSIYYLVDDEGKYVNDTGCGNTLNANHPVVLQMILDSLRYFVTEFHIDGFRFDLASIFYRSSGGEILHRPPILQAIAKDPILSTVKLIAEPWDAAGLFQLGNFYTESRRFAEWNSFYRDDVRRFLKGDPGTKGAFATRIAGSQDLYGHAGRTPSNSINFITCHDGFTLQDLTSYNRKHNLENGEDNQDGSNHNDSWNCGIEGPSEDPGIRHLRDKQMRNFHLATMLSLGIPMLLMGDEYGHSRKGNNNSWCQDNPLNWMQWEEIQKNSGFFRFYQKLIHFRRQNPLLQRNKFLNDQEIAWHGALPFHPHWESDVPFLAFTLSDHEKSNDLYAAFNASHEEVTLTLPPPPENKRWHWIINTSIVSPDDYRENPSPIETGSFSYRMEAYSSLLLEALP